MYAQVRGLNQSKDLMEPTVFLRDMKSFAKWHLIR